MSHENMQGLLNTDRLHRLLRRMVDIYSPSGKEAEILACLMDFFKEQGIPFQMQTLDDGRFNLIVRRPENAIELALIGHVDTVSAYDLEQVNFRQQGNTIFGLGTADMKSGCAALVEAFTAIWQAGYQQLPVALILVVGEEEEGDGTARLLESDHFPWALIAEPTNLIPCMAHCGYVEAQLKGKGRRRHASLANHEINPVETVLNALLALTRYMSERQPKSVYNIRDLLTPPSGFAVPEWCEAWLDFHIPPHSHTGELCIELEEVIRSQFGDKPGTSPDLRFHTIQDGYRLPQKGRPVEILQQIFTEHGINWQTKTFQSHSDANLLWAHGVRPILMGPGSLAKAHTPDESVHWHEVVKAADIYQRLIHKLIISAKP
jgi:acetylornithine deacetylase